jgi:hypothetical protein
MISNALYPMINAYELVCRLKRYLGTVRFGEDWGGEQQRSDCSCGILHCERPALLFTIVIASLPITVIALALG